ncbi:MAG: hypothetical protein OXC45_03430 [Gemmatimonadetes bacterium]|nr:hypothetical protein [Gemmatimonadota bacterium]
MTEKALTELKCEILHKIESAARNGEIQNVILNSKLLESVEGLLADYRSMESKFEGLKRSFTLQSDAELPLFPPIGNFENEKKNDETLSAKAQGQLRREAFIEIVRKKGKRIEQVKGVRYNTEHGDLLGVASASEKSPGRWALGLPPARYGTFVLLCEDTKGEIHTFIASRDFTQKFIDKLSRDYNGQIKLNVKKTGSKFYLTIPGSHDESIVNLKDQFENI